MMMLVKLWVEGWKFESVLVLVLKKELLFAMLLELVFVLLLLELEKL